MASNNMRIATKNLQQLRGILRGAESELGVDDLKQVFFEGVDMIRAAALTNVRRLFKKQTGNLENSLIAMKGNQEDRATAFTKSVYKTAPHAHLLEFGHAIHRTIQRAHLGGKDRVEGAPWFRPAVDGSKTAVRAHINARIKGLLATAFTRGHSSDDVGWMG